MSRYLVYVDGARHQPAQKRLTAMHELARHLFEKRYGLYVVYAPEMDADEPWFVSWNPHNEDRETPIERGADPYTAFLKACRYAVRIEIIGAN